MPGTETFDLTATPVALTGLPATGDRVMLANAGDDPIFWSIDASAPSGRDPGFRLPRSNTAIIVAPGSSNRIHAWSHGNSRLMAVRASGTGPIPAATLRVTVDAVPRQLPDFANQVIGQKGLLYVTGGAAVSWVSSESQPDTDSSMPAMDPGKSTPFTASMGPETLWFWCRRFGGSSLLIQGNTDDGWQI